MKVMKQMTQDKISTPIRKEFLLCPLCDKTYLRPKILPCLHTFCLKCLQSWAHKCCNEITFPCPTCRSEIPFPEHGVKGFKNNTFHPSIQDMILAETPDSTMCKLCAEVEGRDVSAAVRCMVCCDYLCMKCREAHLRTRQTREHEMTPVLALQSELKQYMPCHPKYCEAHPQELLNFYCPGCREVVCRECRITTHWEHKCEDLQETAHFYRSVSQEGGKDLNKQPLLGGWPNP